jgi:hypothetical protein
MGWRSRLTDGPSSIGGRSRTARWQLFARLFPDFRCYHILDLGGTAYSWLDAPLRPKKVTLLNLFASELTVRHEAGKLPDWLSLAAGDACDPPQEIRQANFDLVFSNSLIEHVGGVARRKQLATVVSECAPRYWVQTPYRYFPIEPHWIFPGFQFLPLAARAAISQWWPLMHTQSEDWPSAVETALDVELLSITEMRHLFPKSEVHRERIGGVTKSLIAVQT